MTTLYRPRPSHFTRETFVLWLNKNYYWNCCFSSSTNTECVYISIELLYTFNFVCILYICVSRLEVYMTVCHIDPRQIRFSYDIINTKYKSKSFKSNSWFMSYKLYIIIVITYYDPSYEQNSIKSLMSFNV